MSIKFNGEDAKRQIRNVIREEFVEGYTDEFYENYAKRFISIVLSNITVVPDDGS